MISDNDFLLHVLSDGQWHSRDAILAESFRERGCGMTVHSRIADLRGRGHTIKCSVTGGQRRSSFYRLSPPRAVDALEEASLASMAGGVSSSASNPADPSSVPHQPGGALTLFAAPRGAYGDEA